MGKTEKIIIIVTAVILAAIIGVAIYMSVDKSIEDDANFDYVTSDLSNYVKMPENKYKGKTIQIDIAKPHAIDVDVKILGILADHKGKLLNDGGLVTTPVTISAGDMVNVWYRGYVLDENGERNYQLGMCNFSAAEPQSVEIGGYGSDTGLLTPGFELGLVGKNTGDYSRFEKITTGTVKAGQIVYVSYLSLIEGGDQKTDAKTGASVRIDLSDENLEKTYGKGFKEKILGAEIGKVMEFDVTIDGKKHSYSNTSVDFVTECEVNPIVVECYYPYDTYAGTTLCNKDVWFEVYVDSVQQYESREFNDEFVLEVISEKGSKITLDELNKYEGDALTDKYRAYTEAIINKEYEDSYNLMVEEEAWALCLDAAEIKRYPGKVVDEMYAEYENDVYYQYDYTGGSLENSSTGEYEYFEDVDSFAKAYLSLEYYGYDDWKTYLYDMSKSLVKDRLVIFYLIQEEGLTPTAEEYEAQYESTYQEYLDLYVELYFEKNDVTREDYTDEEFENLVEDGKERLKRLPKDYFKERTYYDILKKEMVKWVEVTTLDDK